MAHFSFLSILRGAQAYKKVGLSTLALAVCAGAAHADELVVNGDFSLGNADFGTDYTYIPYDYSNYNDTAQVQNGDYTVGYHVPPSYFDWYPFHDVSGDGQMMVVAGGSDASDPFWDETINVDPNTDYTISFYVAEISTPGINADVAVDIDGVELGDGVAPYTQDDWEQYSFTWNSGTDTSIALSLTDLQTNGDENDFAVDNISMTGPGSSSVPGPSAFIAMGMPLAATLRRRLRR